MLRNHWYIVCFERELKRENPIRRKIAGREVVAFRTDSGKIGVLEDRCCHRNVHLSLGYVKGEAIKCGYHGWEYGTDGKCCRIPSLEPDRSIPETARTAALPVQVKFKTVWAFFGEPSRADTAELPPFDELDDWPFIFNYHEVRGNIKLIAESLFDAQHINHVHRDSIGTMMGDLSNEPTDYHLDVSDRSLRGWYNRYNHRNFFEKIYFGFREQLETHYGFWFPHSSMLDLRFPAHLQFPSRRMIIYEHFYEIDEERCMMIQITTWKHIFRYNPWFAKWFMARKSNRIVEEDIEFLESNRHWHDKRELTDLMVPADELSFAFDKLWRDNIRRDKSNNDAEIKDQEETERLPHPAEPRG